MAAIAIGAVFMCCVCTAVGGGGYLYLEEQKHQDRIKTALMTQGVTWFEECRYKGGIVAETKFDPPAKSGDTIELESIGAKSFIVGPNVSVRFKNGNEMSFVDGPKKFICNLPTYTSIKISYSTG